MLPRSIAHNGPTCRRAVAAPGDPIVHCSAASTLRTAVIVALPQTLVVVLAPPSPFNRLFVLTGQPLRGYLRLVRETTTISPEQL